MQKGEKSSHMSCFLGLDFGTQSLKGILWNETEDTFIQHRVDYDNELPHYNTTQGVLHKKKGQVVVPSLMVNFMRLIQSF